MMFSKLFTSLVIFSGCVYTYSPALFGNSNSSNDIMTNSLNSGYSILHMNEWKHMLERKMCGESLRHVAGLVVDKTDKEAKVIVEGSIRTNKLILKLGCVKEKEIYIKNILLPIETISSKCINIRQKIQEDSTILCLESKFMRNFWNNSITDAVLCHETKVKGKLPQYNYSEDTKTEEEQLNTTTINEDIKDIANAETKEITSEDTDEVTNENTNETTNEDTNEVIIEDTSEETKDITREDTNKVISENTNEATSEENKNESPEITNEENIKSETIEETTNEEEIKRNDEWKQNILKEEFEDEIEKNEEQKGLKLRIAKSKYGYPNVKINGTDIQEFKKNNKTGELRSTNAEDNENETNMENEVSEEIEESATE